MFFQRNACVSLTGLYIFLLVHSERNLVECRGITSQGSLQFFAIGDWGGLPKSPYSTDVERAVAKGMGMLAERYKPEYILALGDNFYDLGVKNVDDERFKETFEDVYTAPSLNIPWYFCAGNHDHHGNVSAQIAYSKKSSRWNFPDYNYSKIWEIPGSKFPVWASQQWAWINDTLAKSTSDYLLVAGHYPVWSIAEHGPTDCLVEKLKPLLEEHNVTAYLCGHDHNLQHLDEESVVQYVVTGCSNYVNTSNDHLKNVPRNSSKFFWADYSKLGGFATFHVTPRIMDMTFVDSTGKPLYSISLNPRNTSDDITQFMRPELLFK